MRILRISARQMQSWERAGLIPSAEHYTFTDLLTLRKLRELRAKRVRSAVILKSLQEMRLAAGMVNPLLEAGVYSTGNRLAFRHSGKTVEPIAGQFVMDFAETERVIVVAGKGSSSAPAPNVHPMRSTPETVAELFAQGVALEESPATQDHAIELYRQVLALDSTHAAAHINLGTIFYNRHDYVKAEQYYRFAIQADPRYALAYFDLGNVLDETGRLDDAIHAYTTALLLAPTYADAHYNVALAYEKLKQPRKALTHWRTYVKLDGVGPWANHARAQIQKIMGSDPLRIVARRRSS